MSHATRNFSRTVSRLALAVAFAGAATTPAVFAQNGVTVLEEVTVTAQRRSQNIQDVPIAVTAISSEALEARGLADISELSQSVPSLTLEPSRATNTTLTAFIRGVGQQDPLAGFEQGVALYIDDVYLARPQGALLDIYDVERIEVLRGPQGTLYGRNAVGGAVKYVTRRLSDEFDMRVKGSFGNYAQRDLVATVSAPLSEDFRVGATVASFQRDGFGDNRFTGGEQYDKDIVGYRLSAEWDASDDVLVRFSYDDTTDESSAVAGYRPFAANTIDAPALSDVRDTRAGASEAETGTTTGIGGRNQVESDGMSLSIEWTVSDNLTLRSITADREDYTESVIDFDSLSVADFDAPVIYENEQFSQEFQALMSGDNWNAIAGAYYLDSKAANDFDVVLGTLGVVAFGAPLTAYTGGVVETEAWSVYGDVTYDVSDRLSVAFGLRYTEDERTADIFRASYLGLQSPAFGNDDAIFLAASSDYEASRTFNNTSPRLNVAYAMSDTTNVYATYSEGWKAGSFDPRGANFSTPAVEQGFEDETLTSFEVGLKTTWLDGRAVTNIAVFMSDYEDMQIPGSVGVDSDGDGANDSFVGTVTNAGKAEINGLEIEGSIQFNENWRGEFAGNILDADFTDYIVNGENIASAREVQNTPEDMAYLALVYGNEVMGGAFNATLNYVRKGAVAQFEVPNPILDQDSYGMWNASVTWASPNDTWRLGLHGKNLNDEDVKTSGYCFGAGDGPATACPSTLGLENNTTVFYAPPRTIVGTIEYRL